VIKIINVEVIKPKFAYDVELLAVVGSQRMCKEMQIAVPIKSDCEGWLRE
jgi:hypothetical protein